MQTAVPLACFLSMIRPPGVQFENALLQIAPVDKVKCPFMRDSNDVGFRLYTRHNPTVYQELVVDDDEKLFASNIDYHAPTVIYFHAFMENPDDGSAASVREAYVLRGDTNVIMVDASRLEAGPWYFTAAENTWYIGKFAAQFVDYLVSRGLDLSKTHFVGHSLGAQAAGVAGSSLKSGRVARITGLDPALPLFHGLPAEQRLDKSDAEFVDVIHTDAGIFGVNEPVGHADFYPNGGISPQPGCELEVVIPQHLLLNKCENTTQLGFYTYHLTPHRITKSMHTLTKKLQKLFTFIHSVTPKNDEGVKPLKTGKKNAHLVYETSETTGFDGEIEGDKKSVINKDAFEGVAIPKSALGEAVSEDIPTEIYNEKNAPKSMKDKILFQEMPIRFGIETKEQNKQEANEEIAVDSDPTKTKKYGGQKKISEEFPDRLEQTDLKKSDFNKMHENSAKIDKQTDMEQRNHQYIEDQLMVESIRAYQTLEPFLSAIVNLEVAKNDEKVKQTKQTKTNNNEKTPRVLSVEERIQDMIDKQILHQQQEFAKHQDVNERNHEISKTTLKDDRFANVAPKLDDIVRSQENDKNINEDQNLGQKLDNVRSEESEQQNKNEEQLNVQNSEEEEIQHATDFETQRMKRSKRFVSYTKRTHVHHTNAEERHNEELNKEEQIKAQSSEEEQIQQATDFETQKLRTKRFVSPKRNEELKEERVKAQTSEEERIQQASNFETQKVKRTKRFISFFKQSEEAEQENFLFKMLNFLLKNRKNIVPVYSVMREINTLVKSANGELNHISKERNNYIGAPPPTLIPVTYSLELANENKVIAFLKKLLGFPGKGDRLTINGSGK